MSQVILKKSSVAGKVPVAGDLVYGEVALNYADGLLYFKTNTNSIGIIGGAGSITNTQISNWTDAYNWGNHALAGYLTSISSAQVTSALGFTPYSATNPSGFTSNTGTVTSVLVTVPTGLTATNTAITTSGTIAIGLDVGYSIPTTVKQANWDTAYTNNLRWDGGATGLVAATGRTSLGLVIGTNVQAWDADLDAIAGLAATSGFLKKTAANAWTLDTNTYLQSSSLSTAISISNFGSALAYSGGVFTVGKFIENISNLQGIGFVKRDSTGIASIDTNTYITGNQSITISGDATGTGATAIALTLAASGVTAGSYGSSTAIPVLTIDAKGRITAASTSTVTIGAGALTLGIGTAGATNTTVTVGTGTGFNANSSAASTYDIKVGPALTALATLMATAGAGFIRRGATADTYTIDTNTYLTSYTETDTLATVTARGANTTAAINTSSHTINVTSGTDRFFINATGTVNSFSVYENSSTAYINSYSSMWFRANQNGGSGGSIGFSGGLVQISNQATINTTTPGTVNYGLHFTGQTTADYATGITWNGGTGTTGAMAGIYVQGSGNYGTKMYIATTDSYAIGSKTAISIDHTGLVNFVRTRPQYAGNTILDAANYTSYSPTLAGTGASGTWGISITGSAVSASYATYATYLNGANYIQRRGTSGNYITDFQNTPAGSMSHQGDDSNVAGNPGGTWWFLDNYRHSNSSSYWGTQVAWGWEDNANRLATRNITGNSFGAWVYYLNSSNYNSYSPTLTGGGASGTWSIAATAVALHASNEVNIGGGYTGNSRLYINYNDGGSITEHAFYNGGTSLSGLVASYGTFSGAVVAYSSDERLKCNFTKISSPIQKLRQITGYEFDWDLAKCSDMGFVPTYEHEHGVKAQEIQKIIPDAVVPAPFDTDEFGKSISGENYLTVHYDRIVPLLIEAVKFQQDIIDLQGQRISRLEALVEKLIEG